jgi:hypothetical protein
MFANRKSSGTGFVAIIAVLAAALGGCAESVATGVAAGFPLDDRNAVTLSRLDRPQLVEPRGEETRVVPIDTLASAREETKRTALRVRADAVH